MIKQNFLIIISLLFLSACGDEQNKIQPLTIEKADGTTIAMTAETAETASEQMRGLMNVTHMPEKHGMLFVFDDSKFRSFWMKNTLIPLDMIFINSKGVIGHIHHHANPNDLSGVPSEIPAMYVLEINGGLSAKWGIAIGDKVFHDKIKRTLAE